MKVYDEYEVATSARNFASGEVDHFYPLCAGGSNDLSNLWYMPAHLIWYGSDYGYKTKDALEAWICTQIKAGKLDPKVAYEKITTDWVAYYQEVFLHLTPLATDSPVE
jgi:hypothetical protein